MNAHSLGPLLTAALDFATQTWPVFPCHPESKQPLTRHGLNDATTDTAQIRTWWAQHPEAMIGMRMGAPSGLWVLDLDLAAGTDGVQALARLEGEHGALPPTVSARTPRGG